jgi:L-ornithine N5-oxygenase
MSASYGGDKTLDVLGIGFGPSNLALAIALEEKARGPNPLRAQFIERQEEFGWHRGMLIPGARMQISFIKDLVTMRDPASDFSFLAYLHRKGRLPAFINAKSMNPTRVEFHDYLSWAADRLRQRASYGVEATDAAPVFVNDEVRFIDVTARRVADGQRVTFRTRNIVVATGLEPRLPPEAPDSRHVIHSEDLLKRIGDIPADRPQTFVVVGAGQSAAEAVEYLHRSFSLGRVYSVFTRYGYSPADDSPFVNAIFDPETVDLFFHAPDEVKELMFGYHANTNYSVVDGDLIADLHERAYQELVVGERRLIMRNLSRVAAVEPSGTGLDIHIKYLPDGTVTTVHADWVIYATGYRPRNPLQALGTLGGYCEAEPGQPVRLDRSHRVITPGTVRCGIYVQGAAEASHGISATLLSTTAVRAGEIADAIAAGADRERALHYVNGHNVADGRGAGHLRANGQRGTGRRRRGARV